MNQLSLFTESPENLNKPQHYLNGRLLMQIGINQAVCHADKEEPSWSDKAYDFLVKYIRTNKEFMVEDVRESAMGIISDPPSKRAWGGIVLRAKNKGLIRFVRYEKVKNPTAHCANAAVWIKV